MRKFVERLDHISFDPAHSQANEVLYITERAVSVGAMEYSRCVKSPLASMSMNRFSL